MLYHISLYLQPYWGPFRLLQSHFVLIAAGAFVAATLIALALPRLWNRLPRDRGKAICKDVGGAASKGKPTGAGFYVTLLMLPVILVFAPLRIWDLLIVAALYAAMLFGYLDDRAEVPWGELKKGLLDALVAGAIALFVYFGYSQTINAETLASLKAQGIPILGHGDLLDGVRRMVVWLPFTKAVWFCPAAVYVPAATFVLWFTMNATNCSDGVDGLAGALTVVALVMLAVLLYVVVGYRPVADYLLIPASATAARWAVVSMIAVGGFGGYLWYNAEPSKVLMGDAGSRFLGILVATASLMTGNPICVVAIAPVALLNGGGGLAKLVLLRVAKRLGCEIGEDSPIRRVRFPLHDHCKKKLGWSNAQVLMRFMLVQMVAMPILLIILLKVR